MHLGGSKSTFKTFPVWVTVINLTILWFFLPELIWFIVLPLKWCCWGSKQCFASHTSEEDGCKV